MMANKEHEKYISYFMHSSITTIDLRTQQTLLVVRFKEKFKCVPMFGIKDVNNKSIDLKRDLILITGSLYAEILN